MVELVIMHTYAYKAFVTLESHACVGKGICMEDLSRFGVSSIPPGRRVEETNNNMDRSFRDTEHPLTPTSLQRLFLDYFVLISTVLLGLDVCVVLAQLKVKKK